ncbi:MAG: HD domain-containing protein [Candidatus Wallbacteria bacterium]|nr:HD domain-containing protein [Candidatus Wallbacteria bacterium]
MTANPMQGSRNFMVLKKAVNPAMAGLTLAKPVIVNDMVLVEENTTLTGSHIVMLNRNNVKEAFVYIFVSRIPEHSFVETLEQPEPGEPTVKEVKDIINNYEHTLELTQAIQRVVESGEKIDISDCCDVVGYFQKLLKRTRNIILQLINTNTPYNYLLAHSLNTCILAMLLGRRMELAENETLALGITGILHDLGMSMVKDRIWENDRKLTDNEFFEVMKHPIFSRNIIGTIKGVPVTVSVMAYQHHERIDGSGYPKALMSDRIHKLSKIFMVADTYEAASSSRRHRKPKLFHDTVKELINLAGVKYDRGAVKALVTELSLFPVGSFVRLSDGNVAKVVGTNPLVPDRPKIELLAQDKKKKKIDLAREKSLNIMEVLEFNE